MPDKRYIQVILPLRLEWEPCYCLGGADSSSEVQTGDRVKVLFAGKPYIGVVSSADAVPDIPDSKIAEVLELHTGLSRVSGEEIELWRFISSYYLCTIGEVYKAAYPKTKLYSEESALRSKQRMQKMLAARELQWRRRIELLRSKLEGKDEALSHRHSTSVAERLRGQRGKLAAQLEEAEGKLSSLLSGELFEEDAPIPALKPVRSALSAAVAEAGGRPVLYKSASRSGQYISAVGNCLACGKGVLFLVPEIALAKSLEKSFREHFAGALLVHHSGASPSRRQEIACRVRSGEPYVLLGTPSSVFLPLCNLGLVVVDEEQSPFYKQGDSAPRYNSRDAAVVLARIHGASVVLGSSAPSLESEYNAATGKYALLREDSSVEPFRLIDITAERKKNGMLGCISRKLSFECREGRIALIRGFEKEEEVSESVSAVFKGEEDRFCVMTAMQAYREDLSPFDVVALLSADALFHGDDFRGDERAFQLLDSLRLRSRRLLIQTRNPSHQVFSILPGGLDSLLAERKLFSLPPYTRLIDVSLPEGLSQMLVDYLSGRGFNSAYAMPESDGRGRVRVSLPRDRTLEAKKKALCDAIRAFCRERNYRGNVVLDVDPL